MRAGPAGDEVFVMAQDAGQAWPAFTAQTSGSKPALAPTQGINVLEVVDMRRRLYTCMVARALQSFMGKPWVAR